MLIANNGWHASLKALKDGLNTDTWTAWTEKQINRLPLWQVIKLCKDKKSWHKDLLRYPAPSTRIRLNGGSRFKEIIYVNEHTFLFILKDSGNSRRVTPSTKGDLGGIGVLPIKEYRRILLETWLGLAKHVLIGIEATNKVTSKNKPNTGPIHHWVPGHWRKVHAGWKAQKLSPLGVDRTHLGETWVDQYCVHNH